MRRFQCAALAAVAVIGFASVASAADMPTKAPVYKAPVAAPVAAPSWTGWYVGLNAGGGWGDPSIDNTVTSSFCRAGVGGCPGTAGMTGPGYGVAIAQAVPASFDSKLGGFIGGGQIGYNYQTGQAVWGIESDFQGAGLKGNASAVNTVLARSDLGNEFVTVAGTGNQEIDFLGTLRGRIGWTSNSPWLLYATGGLAYGHTKTSASFTETASVLNSLNASAAASTNAWRVGWTIGGGLEWMFASRWSLKGEYLYYDLGRVTLNNTLATSFYGATIASEAHYKGSIARAGVNYHF